VSHSVRMVLKPVDGQPAWNTLGLNVRRVEQSGAKRGSLPALSGRVLEPVVGLGFKVGVILALFAFTLLGGGLAAFWIEPVRTAGTLMQWGVPGMADLHADLLRGPDPYDEWRRMEARNMATGKADIPGRPMPQQRVPYEDPDSPVVPAIPKHLLHDSKAEAKKKREQERAAGREDDEDDEDDDDDEDDFDKPITPDQAYQRLKKLFVYENLGLQYNPAAEARWVERLQKEPGLLEMLEEGEQNPMDLLGMGYQMLPEHEAGRAEMEARHKQKEEEAKAMDKDEREKLEKKKRAVRVWLAKKKEAEEAAAAASRDEF